MRALLVLALLLLAGCGGKGGGDGFETPEKEDQFYVIHLREDRTFDPPRAQVPKDAFVRFHFEVSNCDVRSEQPGGPDSRGGQYANGIHPPGSHFHWIAPSTSGQFDIYCSAHSGMTGVLKVG